MTAPVLFGVLLAAVALAYVIAPLIWPRVFEATPLAGTPVTTPEDAGAGLEQLRDELYARIVDLDFEQATGKTDEQEYQQDRALLKRQALAVLRSLDERAAAAHGAEDEVEREVRLARARRAAALAPAPADVAVPELSDEVERQILALRRTRQAVSRVE